MDEQSKRLHNEMRMLAVFLGQSLALLSADDPVRRRTLDDLVAHFEGMAQEVGAPWIMSVVREGFDKMIAGGRELFPDADK